MSKNNIQQMSNNSIELLQNKDNHIQQQICDQGIDNKNTHSESKLSLLQNNITRLKQHTDCKLDKQLQNNNKSEPNIASSDHLLGTLALHSFCIFL